MLHSEKLKEVLNATCNEEMRVLPYSQLLESPAPVPVVPDLIAYVPGPIGRHPADLSGFTSRPDGSALGLQPGWSS